MVLSYLHSFSCCLFVKIYDAVRFIQLFDSATGGTAFNGVVEELKKLTTRVAHVLPVSDDGGSTAEIVRVLGKFPNKYMASCCFSISPHCAGPDIQTDTIQ